MTQFKKEDIKLKSTDELLKYFHESRFHHQDYIPLVIEVLTARGLTRTILFEKKSTQDLVDIISLNSDKHNDQYLRLILLELEHRKNDVNRKDNYFKSKKGILTAGIVIIIIVVFKLVLDGKNNKDENNNQKAIEPINQREELQNSYQFKLKPIDGNFDAVINFYKNLSAEESIHNGFTDTKAFNKFKSLPINEQVETLIPILENLNEQKANELAIIIMSDTNSFIGRLVMEKIQSYKEMADKYPNVSPEEFSDMLSKDLKSAFIGSKCPKISDKIISQSELIIKKYALKRN